MKRILSYFALVASFAAPCFAANSYDESSLRYSIDGDLRWRNTQVDVASDLRQTIDMLRARALTLEAALREYDVSVPNIDSARKTLADMEKSEYWRDLGSRTTTKRRQAGYNLGKYLYDANALLNVAETRLNEEKERAYLAWAAKHPEEARALEKEQELEQRLQKAEAEARAAREQASAAQSAADAASSAAYDAQRAADDASERAATLQRNQDNSANGPGNELHGPDLNYRPW